MKRLIIASIVTVFACASALQAGESASKDKAGCAGSACCAKEAKAKLAAKKAPEKGATLLVMR